MAKNITVIPATLDRHTGISSDIHYKRRVAGYARVSTDSEEQLTSYEAQVDYYTQYIKANPEWQFVAVYTDEGRCKMARSVGYLPSSEPCSLCFDMHLRTE